MSDGDTGRNFQNNNAHLMDISDQDKLGWTTWLHNATLSLATVAPYDPSEFKMKTIMIQFYSQ